MGTDILNLLNQLMFLQIIVKNCYQSFINGVTHTHAFVQVIFTHANVTSFKNRMYAMHWTISKEVLRLKNCECLKKCICCKRTNSYEQNFCFFCIFDKWGSEKFPLYLEVKRNVLFSTESCQITAMLAGNLNNQS